MRRTIPFLINSIILDILRARKNKFSTKNEFRF